MSPRTLAMPALLMQMSVPVLSLWEIIASRAVRSETVPDRFGGWKTDDPGTQTLSSRGSMFAPSTAASCWDRGRGDFDGSLRSAWSSDSASTKPLNELATTKRLPGFSSIVHGLERRVPGTWIFIAFWPGRARNSVRISRARRLRSAAVAAAAVGARPVPSAAAATPDPP
jgi:hypothetical protein